VHSERRCGRHDNCEDGRAAPDPSAQPLLSASSMRLLPWLIAVAFFHGVLDTTILILQCDDCRQRSTWHPQHEVVLAS